MTAFLSLSLSIREKKEGIEVLPHEDRQYSTVGILRQSCTSPQIAKLPFWSAFGKLLSDLGRSAAFDPHVQPRKGILARHIPLQEIGDTPSWRG